MTTIIHDPTRCALGEGPLWHPERGQLYWFDILGRALLTREAGETRRIRFREYATAAGWIDRATLLVATETQLAQLDLETGALATVAPLEADDPVTRSNDGRADPWGGFWIGTMGKAAEPGAGSIWRYHRGELRRLVPGVTISNAICFAPDGTCAYFTDTATRVVMRWRLAEADGWPIGEAEPWLDLRAEGLNPDGAVTDAEGDVWIAQWGAARVARYGADGAFKGASALPASQISCPAFGGADFTTLFCTSAADGLARSEAPDGATFAIPGAGHGRADYRVSL